MSLYSENGADLWDYYLPFSDRVVTHCNRCGNVQSFDNLELEFAPGVYEDTDILAYCLGPCE